MILIILTKIFWSRIYIFIPVVEGHEGQIIKCLSGYKGIDFFDIKKLSPHWGENRSQA